MDTSATLVGVTTPTHHTVGHCPLPAMMHPVHHGHHNLHRPHHGHHHSHGPIRRRCHMEMPSLRFGQHLVGELPGHIGHGYHQHHHRGPAGQAGIPASGPATAPPPLADLRPSPFASASPEEMDASSPSMRLHHRTAGMKTHHPYFRSHLAMGRGRAGLVRVHFLTELGERAGHLRPVRVLFTQVQECAPAGAENAQDLSAQRCPDVRVEEMDDIPTDFTEKLQLGPADDEKKE